MKVTYAKKTITFAVKNLTNIIKNNAVLYPLIQYGV